MKHPVKSLIIGVVGVGASVIGADALTPEPAISCQDVSSIHQKQTDEFSRSGKYSQFTKNSLPSNVQVTEYRTFKGEVGYQIFCEDAVGFYSVGTGVESDSRTSFEAKPPLKQATST